MPDKHLIGLTSHQLHPIARINPVSALYGIVSRMSSQFPIVTEIKLTESEVYWANDYIVTRQLRTFLWIWVVFGMLMGPMFCLAWINPRPGIEWQETLRGSKPLMVAFAIPLFFKFVVPLLNARKVFADPRNSQPTRYQFSDSGVFIEHSAGNGELNWTAFVKAAETRSCFLLYVTKAWARVIPKRCLANPTEISALSELVRKHLPES